MKRFRDEITFSKIPLIYDGTLLANTFSTSNSDRTGVFFVVYNVFLKLMKLSPFPISVYADDGQLNKVKKALVSFGYGDVPVITEKEISLNSPLVFLSPFTPPPDFAVKNPAVARYMILYDVTPLVLPEIEAPNKSWFDLLEKSLNGTDRYFCISEWTKKDFLSFYPALNPKNMYVTYLAASENFYRCEDKNKISSIKKKYGIPENKSYIFSLCTLQPRKNLIHAVKVFAEFIRQGNVDDLVFVLGGGHWDQFIGLLDKEISNLDDVKERIIKTGYIEDEDLAPLYSDALCTVYVSLYEGFGLPVLEAMQCGCPVITSNSSSLPEVIGDAGMQVDPRDPVALAEAYKIMYENKDFRQDCKRRGLERAKTFSWDACTSQMVEIIKNTYMLSIDRRKKKSSPLISRVRTPDSSTLRIFCIPVASKTNDSKSSIFKLFGLPVIRIIRDGFEVRTKILGLTVGIRPNWQSIDETVNRFSSAITDRLSNLERKMSQEQKKLENELEKIKMYDCIKKVQFGTLKLQDELELVGKTVSEWE